uniref:CSON003571 protein n=1 Tax=Culicoides sonorensis TaxID=179676 RepID=A0A336MLS3_CULSO
MAHKQTWYEIENTMIACSAIDIESATRVRENLNGCDIYSGCCTLKIDYAKSPGLQSSFLICIVIDHNLEKGTFAFMPNLIHLFDLCVNNNKFHTCCESCALKCHTSHALVLLDESYKCDFISIFN